MLLSIKESTIISSTILSQLLLLETYFNKYKKSLILNMEKNYVVDNFELPNNVEKA